VTFAAFADAVHPIQEEAAHLGLLHAGTRPIDARVILTGLAAEARVTVFRQRAVMVIDAGYRRDIVLTVRLAIAAESAGRSGDARSVGTRRAASAG
jgi:hypothetical protein